MVDPTTNNLRGRNITAEGEWIIEHTNARQKDYAVIFSRRWKENYSGNPVVQLAFLRASHGGALGLDNEFGGAWVTPIAKYLDSDEHEVYNPDKIYVGDNPVISCDWHELRLVLTGLGQLPHTFHFSGTYKIWG